MFKVYLSGEIHSNWREEIINLCKVEKLDISFTSPVTDHEASDNCGIEILGSEENNFWKDNKGAKINSIKTKNSIIDCDIVVNVQGDEPFIDPNLIEELVHSFEDDQVSMASAMSKIENIKDIQDPNVVKVVVDTQNNAIYFSRAPIPFPRDHQEIIHSSEELKKHNFFRHIGIYGYQKDFLAKYIKMDQTNLEKLEKLEQLRVIENGFKIKMIEAVSSLIGIDTLEDYEEALKKY